jgi:hypothetical protein
LIPLSGIREGTRMAPVGGGIYAYTSTSSKSPPSEEGDLSGLIQSFRYLVQIHNFTNASFSLTRKPVLNMIE